VLSPSAVIALLLLSFSRWRIVLGNRLMNVVCEH